MQLFSRFIMMDLIFHPALCLSYGNSGNLNGARRKFGRMCFSVQPAISHTATCACQHCIESRSYVQIMKIINKASLCVIPNTAECMKVAGKVCGRNKESNSHFAAQIYYLHNSVYQINK